MVTNKEFGKKIRALRKSLGLSQEQLAEKLDIDNKHLSKIENGLHMPTYRLLNKISEVLHLDIYTLEEKGVNINEKNNDELYIKSLKILNSAKTKQEKQYFFDALHLAQKGLKIGKQP